MKEKQEMKLFKFQWQKDNGGYTVKVIPKTKLRDNPTVMEFMGNVDRRVLESKGGDVSLYSPFDKKRAGMAREFSCISVDKDGVADENEVVAFANKYGELGREGYLNDLSVWGKQVSIFRSIFDFLSVGQVDIALSIYNNVDYLPHMSVKISDGDRKSRRSLQLSPCNLLAAMWLLLADELTNGINRQQCQMPGCNNWFPARSNQRFCGKVCKQVWYRKNKETA